MNIFVAKLDFSIQEHDLQEVFEDYGTVNSVKIIMDKATGRSKGFGFIDMPVQEEGQAAIDELNGAELEGREIVVKESQPQENTNRGRGGYGRDNNRGGGGGYGRDNNRGGGGGYGRDNNRSGGGGGYSRDRY